MSPPRRRGLLDWATVCGLFIEDDYDAEHRDDYRCRPSKPRTEGIARLPVAANPALTNPISSVDSS